MKKMAALILSAVLLFGFAGCSEAAPMETSKPDWWVEATPTPDGSNLKKKGEPFTVQQVSGWNDEGPAYTTLEVTALDYEVFDSFQDTGLPEEDGYLFNDQTFVLVKVKIKKLEGPNEPPENRESWLRAGNFGLVSKKQLENQKKGIIEDILSQELNYFSGIDHTLERDDQFWENADAYWLDVGEEKTFELGFCLDDAAELGKYSDYDPENLFCSVEDGPILAYDNGTGMVPFVDLDS